MKEKKKGEREICIFIQGTHKQKTNNYIMIVREAQDIVATQIKNFSPLH